MGTRGAICRVTDKGFEGRYHHWDSYPSGLGETLWKLYHGHFNEDLDAMLKTLIDDHPAGWSTINGKDFNLKAGFITLTTKDVTKETKRYKKPQCYCHGSRHEKEWLVTQENASGSGCEWVYSFDVEKQNMQILTSMNEDGTKMIGYFGCGNEKANWVLVKEIDLNGIEPNWEKIETQVKEESHKTYERIKRKERQEFLHNMNEAFSDSKHLGIYTLPHAHYLMWYRDDVSEHLDQTEKIDIAKRISKLTLRSPIWTDKDTNYIEQFPELKRYSHTGHISGLQLCAVMTAIVNELQEG